MELLVFSLDLIRFHGVQPPPGCSGSDRRDGGWNSPRLPHSVLPKCGPGVIVLELL